jgi:hypothetical protein
MSPPIFVTFLPAALMLTVKRRAFSQRFRGHSFKVCSARYLLILVTSSISDGIEQSSGFDDQSPLSTSEMMNLNSMDDDLELNNVREGLIVERILSAEVRRATANIAENREEWTLQGTPDQQSSALLDLILTTPAIRFGREPKISLLGNIALDMGGPFRQYVTNVFNSLLNSDDMFSDDGSELRSFRERPPREFTYHRNKYIIFPKTIP